MTFAPSEDSDQPGRRPSLIKVFAVHMKKHWILSYPLFAPPRLWSDVQVDLSLPLAHSHFVTFVMRRLIFLVSYQSTIHIKISSFLVSAAPCGRGFHTQLHWWPLVDSAAERRPPNACSVVFLPSSLWPRDQFEKKGPVIPLTPPTLLFRANPTIFIAILKKKNKKIYSPTNPFIAWQFLTKVYENVRIATILN